MICVARTESVQLRQEIRGYYSFRFAPRRPSIFKNPILQTTRNDMAKIATNGIRLYGVGIKEFKRPATAYRPASR